jgi:outer membrane protein assembly factor BamA
MAAVIAGIGAPAYASRVTARAMRACCALGLLAHAPDLAASPQATPTVQEAVTTMEGVARDRTDRAAPEEDAGKADLIVVPIPQSSPSLGAGITLGGALFYNPNGSKEPWTSGAAIMATSNGSMALGVGHRMFLGQDRFKLTAFLGYGDVNLRFYGVGPAAGELNKSVDISERGLIAFVDPQVRIAPNFYVGLRALALNLQTSLRRDQPEDPDVELPPPRVLDSRLVQLGPVAVYDTRDNSLDPHTGIYAQAAWLRGVPGLGSDFSNDRVTLYGNVYRSLGARTVLAARVSTCAVSRDTPFYDICLYGASSDLRGYETGRYRDNASWATQAEIRHRVKGRFGVAAFVGVGGTAPSFGDLGDSTILPAGGAGIRFQASKTTPINLRIDYAVGKDSEALYISVGEAF